MAVRLFYHLHPKNILFFFSYCILKFWLLHLHLNVISKRIKLQRWVYAQKKALKKSLNMVTNKSCPKWTKGAKITYNSRSLGLCPLQGHCPASHSDLQSCKAGQRVSLITYCPQATGYFFGVLSFLSIRLLPSCPSDLLQHCSCPPTPN